MVISESNKFIFLHNPKCAGTSIRTALREFDTRSNYYWLFDEIDGYKIDKAHMPLNIFRRFAPDDFNLIHSYFVFGFVRNPYARVLSGFNEGRKPLYRDFTANKIELSEYQLKLNKFVSQLTKKNVNGWDIRYRHFVNQTNMFWLEGKLYADVIIKVEELNDRLELLNIFLPEVGAKLYNNLKTKNEKPMTYTPEQLLTQHSIEIINTVYHDDFIVFDYPMIK